MIDRNQLHQAALSWDMSEVLARRQLMDMVGRQLAETGQATIGHLVEPVAVCLFLDEVNMLLSSAEALATDDDATEDDARALVDRITVLMTLARRPDLLSYVRRVLMQACAAQDQLEFGPDFDITDPVAVEEFVANGAEVDLHD